ncbi:MalY/PatB family protein [Desertibacillus haloalkaliphilus]|uniref:MalY/PatB family protein n=1 Tax=Desertibacillus haloalkaliphilus TaxID=1328930 RepID=UPI001C25499F|nr:MalY/PatB family protein [Desertibacillus haloalkaliphilus]MBU8905300.1 pyridoxal phosphate-dependent aminotransferase [Desertibacillus haloalkaliphilus]
MGNFDKVIDRTNTNSTKWDAVDKLYNGKDLWPMWVADMDFRAPEAVLEAIQEKVEHGILGYTVRPESLDQAVVNWFKTEYGWTVDPKALQYTAGVVPTITQLIQAFTDEDDKIIIQTPVYYPFYSVVTNVNRRLVKNPLQFDGKQYRFDFDHLEASIDEHTKMLILCNPHNPAGRVWSKEELQRLAEICKKHDLLVISDEIHADLMLNGHHHVPFASLSSDTANRTITCLAPSKTFNLAGIQSSITVIENEQYYKKFAKHLQNQFLFMPNLFASVATEAAYRHGKPWLTELRAYLEDNLRYVINFVGEHMPKIKVVEPEGTYLVWLDCSELGMTAAERRKWLEDKAKVALSHGSTFGEEGKDFERMNIACPRQTLTEGLERLKRAYQEQEF